MRIRSFENWNKLNEERALRTLPTDEEYWKRKGKTGKEVALYTHDDMDGIFCAIEMKKWLLDHGYDRFAPMLRVCCTRGVGALLCGNPSNFKSRGKTH